MCPFNITFLSSLAAEGGEINGCDYTTSKASLNSIIKSLPRELVKFGISVNRVASAMVGDTGSTHDPSILKGTPGDVVNIPVGRLGTP